MVSHDALWSGRLYRVPRVAEDTAVWDKAHQYSGLSHGPEVVGHGSVEARPSWSNWPDQEVFRPAVAPCIFLEARCSVLAEVQREGACTPHLTSMTRTQRVHYSANRDE